MKNKYRKPQIFRQIESPIKFIIDSFKITLHLLAKPDKLFNNIFKLLYTTFHEPCK